MTIPISKAMAEATKRFVVVTGANKGIGLEICRQLSANGLTVVLTARNEKKGLEALEKLKESGLSHVVYHQLDVTDPASVASLADYIKTQFGRLDILVNNAAILGAALKDPNALGSLSFVDPPQGKEGKVHWSEILTETFELGEECLKTNYYGAKRMIEALIPLLQLSDSPRIINLSSRAGQLQNITNEWAKGVLSGAEELTEERVDEVLNEFRKDFKEAKSWSIHPSAYTISKAALNAYSRIMAKKYPTFYINCVCPGYAKTDMNFNTGFLTIEEGAESTVRLALLPDGGPSGQFFLEKEVSEY